MRFLVLWILALLLVCSNASAHLISAGFGAINIQPEKTSVLIGVPVSMFTGVDLNGDGFLQPDEIKSGRLQIIEQLQSSIQLRLGDSSGTVIDDQLMVSVHVDNKNSTNQIEWLRFLDFPKTALTQAITVNFKPEALKSDYLLQVRRLEDTETAVLSNNYPSHTFLKGPWGTLTAFTEQGVLHILSGMDHIVFLLMLLSASVASKRWVLVLTSFTLAHGVTYSLATYGVLYVKPSLIEPVIAFTIVLAALLHLLHWRPNLMVESAGIFSLGLFHGLGFASSMAAVSKDLRFPIHSVLGFNLGVELGQLTIAFLLWGVFANLSRFKSNALNAESLSRWVAWGAILLGSYWFFDRVWN
jgi:hydrogenase/urease accessory protein HupE